MITRILRTKYGVELRDANFYGLPIVTTENCKNFQFSTDYGNKLLQTRIFLQEFLKKEQSEMLPKKR